ncbi:ABC transporter ATP-binding protein [Allosediminivita pacifica]|uniref:Glutathione import ATP-binding protein GsiA n=1 Tax=Allosediminivita pacifica TaxID=1267769 RepID=A0A2T6AD71_9RHOB|nr:ABC transporter ATP-binding protein [Allosediminivita pacifica]PTX41761.1 peptide/nickel transport system ATP-binding protein [Allosediminivita pacifica]GGB22736.1 ATP-binding protein [Allosediminivita pacifica]
MNQPVFSVSGLEVAFRGRAGWKPVVHDVSLEIARGETLALVGESGSGKSVTSLASMRLLDPESSRIGGKVMLEGRDLLALSEAEMRGVRGNDMAMIFQEPMTSLNPSMKIGEQIAEVLAAHRDMSRQEALAETERLLERVRIPAARQRMGEYPHQSSGGMRQRFMIAMALACRPRLLIADEPTTALDVTIQAQILELIKVLQEEEDMAVLFITHDMGVVAEVADRTIVMHHGRAVEQGATEALFGAPKQPYTRALLSAVPRLGSMSGSVQPARFPLVEPDTGQPVPGRPVKDHVVQSAVPLLQVRGLTTRYTVNGGMLGGGGGRVHAVEGLDFDIRPGETLSLVGESGCGKSSAGRTILGLTEAHGGSVKLEGKELVGLSRRAIRPYRRKMQMIFQDPFASLDPRCRIGDAIAEPMLTHRLVSRAEAPDRVADLLEKVGLHGDMARRYPNEFSGGQRQRLCIARALGMAPNLIVADEAVSALDVSIKAQVINLMLDLQEDLGLSYLFISHDMAVVERMSHRVAVMYLGEIVEIGPRAAIFENPQHPYTCRLLSAVPVPDPARRGMRRGLDVRELKSPVRPHGYEPPLREWRTVSPGHRVQVPGPEWTGEMAQAATGVPA